MEADSQQNPDGRHPPHLGRGVSPDGIREGATTDDPATELGRTSLTMGKPSSLVETLKITLAGAGGAEGKLRRRVS